jgi:hypothetical protein
LIDDVVAAVGYVDMFLWSTFYEHMYSISYVFLAVIAKNKQQTSKHANKQKSFTQAKKNKNEELE